MTPRRYRRPGLDGAFVDRVIAAAVLLPILGIIAGGWHLGRQWGWW